MLKATLCVAVCAYGLPCIRYFGARRNREPHDHNATDAFGSLDSAMAGYTFRL